MLNWEFWKFVDIIILIIYNIASFVIIYAMYALPDWELKLLCFIFAGYPIWLATIYLWHEFSSNLFEEDD